jgi:membrane AbrB-like protein
MTSEHQSAGPWLGRKSKGLQWAGLLVFSVLLAWLLEIVHLPAALLLGPMIAAIVMAACEGSIKVPSSIFVLSQSFVGCMMARSVPLSLVGEIARDWPIFLAGIFSVLVCSSVLGLVLTRWQVMPGTTAIWGSSPGAAAAMTLMAGAYGADVRLVAFMQYLRVVCVAVTATLVSRIWTSGGGELPAVIWFPAVQWLPMLQTVTLALFAAFVAPRLRIPGAPLLVPLVLGGVLQNTGLMAIELPPWLLAASFGLLGWSIGLRFTRPILAHAVRALPSVLASTLTLIASCGVFAALLVVFAGVDPLTAYLATSPGGADSVAIIAAAVPVDVPFVMTMQTSRFLVVLLTGPALARLIVKLAGVKDEPPLELRRS